MNFVTQKSMNRRTVLRGLGATIALPLLDSMVPAQTLLRKTAGTGASRVGAPPRPACASTGLAESVNKKA